MYIKQVWENSPSTRSPINSARLNHLETQYDQAVVESLIQAKQYVDNALIGGATSGVVRVSDFVAPQGGAVDVSDGVQLALNAAGGQLPVVFETGGVYGVSKPLILPAGQKVLGSGATIAMMEGSGTGFAMTNFSLEDVTTPGYEGSSGISVMDLIFDGQGTSISRRVNLLTFNHCRDIRVINCRFIRSRGYHALEFNAVNGALAEGCSFEGFVTMGLTPKEAIQVDCGTPGSIDSGLRDGTMSRNVDIRNCRFSGLGALPAHEVGVGSHARSVGNFYDNVNVESCYFEGHTVAGVQGLAWRASSVRASQFINCAIGAQLKTSETSTISNCSYKGAGTQAFVLSDSSIRCSVESFNAEGAGEGVLVSTLSEGCTVSSGRTYRTSGFGIVVAGGSDTFIPGCAVFGAGDGPSSALTAAIRITASLGATARNAVTGCIVRPHGVSGTPEPLSSVSSQASATDTWVFGNDFRGMASATAGTVNTTSNRI